MEADIQELTVRNASHCESNPDFSFNERSPESPDIIEFRHGDLPGDQISDPATRSEPGPEGGKGGEGGNTLTPFTGFPPSNSGFMANVFSDLPEGAHALVTAKEGDPEEGGWFPADSGDVDRICRSGLNTYFCCSSVFSTGDGKLLARKESAAAYHCLVLDDVGTKVDRTLVSALAPTWELETSPGNYQVGFKFAKPLTDAKKIDQFQRQIRDAGLTDTGALGMMRWARLPNGINGKPKYSKAGAPFHCNLKTHNPQIAYSSEQIIDALVPNSVGLDEPKHENRRITSQTSQRDLLGVYTAALGENPVLTALKKQGLYKREISPGRHDVTCPWVAEHTDALDTGAAYFEPNKQHPVGGFVCQHSHKDKYRTAQFLEHLELTPQQARNRPLIRIVDGQMDNVLTACETLLANEHDYYQSGGVIVTVKVDPQSGDVSLATVSEAALTRKLSQISDWEKWNAKANGWALTDPPARHVSLLNKLDSYQHLPNLQGLTRQPYFREGDGKLILSSGYDPVSGRLGVFDSDRYEKPEQTREAAEKALALLIELIDEFHFAQDADRAAALAAIFTAVTRPSLGLAPAFHVSAPNSGSGKSFLCETIALFATPGKPAKTSYPKTSEEATKAILSLLLVAPAVVEFDDMDTDWIPFGPINRMLTASSITDRILGVSKVATVGTSVLFLGSGNNVGPVRDLARRVLTINLNAQSESPATLTYKGNPVATLRAKREQYVSAVLTIIEAWKAAGSPKAAVPSIASYGGLWSDYCRHPLLWLGQTDPATVLLDQILHDPDADILKELLSAWHAELGETPVQVRQVLNDRYTGDLWEAIMELPVVENGKINKSKFGWYLKRQSNRISGGFKLEKVPASERTAWRVVQVTPPSPPLPPSTAPDHAEAASVPTSLDSKF